MKSSIKCMMNWILITPQKKFNVTGSPFRLNRRAQYRKCQKTHNYQYWTYLSSVVNQSFIHVQNSCELSLIVNQWQEYKLIENDKQQNKWNQ